MSGNYPRNLYTASQTRDLDRIAIEERGIPGINLMKRAGKAVFVALQARWPDSSLMILCGSGNNAGDGYVVAGLAAERQIPVTVYYLAEPEKLSGDAKLALDFARRAGVEIRPWSPTLEFDDDTVIVDAMLGTGLNGAVRRDYAEAIEQVNESDCPVISVDIPSGLNADTGMPMGAAVHAECTVTFIGMKQGLLTGNAADFCGDLIFDSLAVPPEIYLSFPPSVRCLAIKDFAGYLSPRRRCAHKGDYGHLLIIGGNHGFGGATIMAAEAALRTGGGLVSVATRAEHVGAALARVPAAMVRSVDSIHAVQPMIDSADAIVIGPGLGKDAWSDQMLYAALQARLPMVIDADALNLLPNFEAEFDRAHPEWILTPHPGEAARLLNLSATDVQKNRYQSVAALEKKYQANVLLKGAGSLTCFSSELIGVCPYGNPGMATGGMGDVLSGIIGGLLVQGMTPDVALSLGICLHGRAADIAAEEGERGLSPTDLFEPLRQLVNGLRI
ncbi:MAG: NAD(P)H-hydrate dehydratase [bacterium]